MRIIVTGLPNEGKSTIAMVIAAALKEKGFNPVVIDPCDQPFPETWHTHQEKREKHVLQRMADKPLEVVVMQHMREGR